ncbi:MAG TPA: hypothetical protein PLH63_00620 [Candidatus Cloacimonadota bacterium]|nr:hypothetical protein [Candidatus Cloacimonadota bacterium]
MKFFINRKLFTTAGLLITLFLLVFLTACDKRSLDPNAIQLTKLDCNKTELYEDNGASWATLRATVKDNNGFPVFEQNINFRSDNPNISFLPARALTDSSGIAKSDVFVSGDILNGQDSLRVTVYAYLGTKTYLTRELLVRKNPQAERIVMQGVNNMTLDVNYDMNISAIAYDSNNQIMPNGTVVKFQTNGGYFIDTDEVISETEISTRVVNGTASVRYNTGTTSGRFTITAYIGTVYADNPKSITIRSGVPKLITCSPVDPVTEEVVTDVIVNSPPIKIVGRLTDEWSNPIVGRIVSLSSNLGVIPQSVTTIDDGIFSANFNPGTTAGIALIEAACDSAKTATMLNINTEGVQSLRFTSQGTINLSVQGSGGTESATLGVKLYDNIGNVVNQAGYNIKFSFESKPEGVKINGGETAIVQTDMSGLATVFITSGTKSGIAVLRAELVDANGNQFYPEMPVVVRQGQIIIQAGKPNTVAFTIGGHDSGVDLGAGNWKVIIGAIIKDKWGNPVEKNTGVYFSLTDETTGVYGDSVSVYASSYVGNVSAIGDSADGTAYSTLVYHGCLSNMSIGIKASVGSYDGVPFEFDGRITLPMQNASIEVVPREQHLDFTTPEGTLLQNVKTVLYTSIKDGQNNPLRNVPLIFNVNRGIFNDGNINYSAPNHPFWDPTHTLYSDIPEDADVFTHTGITGYNGMNNKWIAFYKYEALPSPQEPIPQDTSADIIVYIVGYNTQATTSVILRRFDQ